MKKQNRKPRFTIEEHDNLGKELFAMRDRIIDIHIQLSKAYPYKTNVPGKASKVLESIDALRCRLDDMVFIENRHLPTKQKAQIYYRNLKSEQIDEA